MSEGTQERILVADDEYGTRTVLAKTLRRYGYEVLEAADGEEALQLAVTHPLDLVILDIRMPRMRGDELARWVERLDPDVSIIFMSAYPGYESALAAVRCHAADYIEKPFRQLSTVVETVQRALDRRRQALQRAEMARNLAEKEHVDELKRHFLSAVAHELRTPLTVIKSFASVLQRGVHGDLNADQSGVMEQIQGQADRLAHEIDKLLSLARLENEDFLPDLAPVKLEQILTPVETSLRQLAAEKDIEALVEVEDREHTLKADRQDIQRALIALVENAVKFTGEGGRVTLTVFSDESGTTFAVADTGIGVAPADHERIFQMFAQVENPLTRSHGGSGIGLAFASRVVEAHRGRMELVSQLGEGSRFAFRIPASQAGAQAAASTSGTATGSVTAEDSGDTPNAAAKEHAGA